MVPIESDDLGWRRHHGKPSRPWFQGTFREYAGPPVSLGGGKPPALEARGAQRGTRTRRPKSCEVALRVTHYKRYLQTFATKLSDIFRKANRRQDAYE
jgi:hypothetical protein